MACEPGVARADEKDAGRSGGDGKADEMQVRGRGKGKTIQEMKKCAQGMKRCYRFNGRMNARTQCKGGYK